MVVDEVLAGIDVSTPADAHWRDRLTALLGRMRAAISAHPATVPLVPRHRKSATGTRRWMEAMLSVLAEGGFDGPDRVIAQRTLVAFLLGSLENQHYASINAPATTAIAQLSPEEYPMLTQTAAQARKMSVDDEFRGGLEICLARVGAVIDESRCALWRNGSRVRVQLNRAVMAIVSAMAR
ncbi:TetR/AcrR family transcriptional regulator C-terminal domain-containing protein [Nocardia sp. NPDC050175]|uniref:TetR/AcrR family transcriptional regulator C-terminal domain-containing protein n=1 Tax=Nocardia sp. NPDC050175 TaxID=3364317 RepID=UPI0037B7F9B8